MVEEYKGDPGDGNRWGWAGGARGPGEHSLPRYPGGKPGEIPRFFAANPNYLRLLGTAQVASGLWLALRQYREE